jgi:hypothetical protein
MSCSQIDRKVSPEAYQFLQGWGLQRACAAAEINTKQSRTVMNRIDPTSLLFRTTRYGLTPVLLGCEDSHTTIIVTSAADPETLSPKPL